MLIALVGGDGAGKSTAVRELSDWLTKAIDTRSTHLGRPAWSWTTYLVRFLAKGVRIATTPFTRHGSRLVNVNESGGGATDCLSMLKRLCTARDRYNSYVAARRFAAKGGIALCDRYPLPWIRRMDAPLMDPSKPVQHKSSAVQILAQWECNAYGRFILPDQLIVLRLDPQVAVARKTDEEASSVRARSQEVWNANWDVTTADVVDASPAQENVLATLKSLIWSRL